MKNKIGLIVPTYMEFTPFEGGFENIKSSKYAALSFSEGIYGGNTVVAVICGVCKVNAAIAAQILIDKFDVTHIVVCGVAGGMDKRLKIGDTVISERTAYHDADMKFISEYHTTIKNMYFEADCILLSLFKKAAEESCIHQNIYFGTIVTGEKFIDHDGRKEINEKFSPLCVDMETAAAAHVCYVNSIPYIAIRSISDTEDESGIKSFEENCKDASISSFSVFNAVFGNNTIV